MSDSRDNLCRQSTPFYSGSFHTSSTGDSIYASNIAMNEGDGGLNGYRHGYAEPIYENYSSLPRRLPMHLQRGAPLNNTFHGAYPSYMYEDNQMRPQQNNQMRPQQDAPVYENLVPYTEKLPQILILGAKKVGKHSFCNLHKRITFRKKIKGEPFKEFNIHNEKNYFFASSMIDVVILCFASDIKKSLTEVESTWKRFQLNQSGVPVLVVMTRAEKQKVSNDKMYRRGKQYSGSIGAKFCSISSD
uniref:Uncharacterized protein n=1 Tax=Ciona savignyi TaxID=51511 RepID=H2Z7Q5_CIOSA